jgi:hypothetical protein
LSVKTKRYQILQYVSALVIQGAPIESLCSLADLVRPDCFKLALGFFLTRPRKDKDSMAVS